MKVLNSLVTSKCTCYLQKNERDKSIEVLTLMQTTSSAKDLIAMRSFLGKILSTVLHRIAAIATEVAHQVTAPYQPTRAVTVTRTMKWKMRNKQGTGVKAAKGTLAIVVSSTKTYSNSSVSEAKMYHSWLRTT